MSSQPALARRLGLLDAVGIGLGAMVGAGVFASFGPATAAAGDWLLAALAVAAVVALCNALSSARLAARYPESGGTYVYGRERLGPFWGHLAGWAFVVGKTASCAAMALTVGAHIWPGQSRAVAVAAVALVTALNLGGVQRGARAALAIVTVVITVLLALVVWSSFASGAEFGWFAYSPAESFHPAAVTPWSVLQGAGFLFFAFAGYARIATLGEEVRDPERTIPRAIPVALAIALALYAAVAAIVLRTGPEVVAGSRTPLVDIARIFTAPWFATVVAGTAVLAAAGSLLALVLGVSRTTLAMARDGHLPRTLAAVHPRRQIPHHAELAVGIVVAVVVLVADVRQAIGFSSFAVLTYYAVANASALTLEREAGTKVVPVVGAAGCVLVALTLPWPTVLVGAAVLVVGVAAYALTSRRQR